MKLDLDVLHERIEKHELAKFETQAVFPEIGVGFANVPFEAHRDPIITTGV